ncbi:hypothetical protein HS088_TW03G00879 [Tripterygium wilfordii]|uniref:LETM1-like protein n=1 Tax=Tripterygium wilfordii TaxID=458696 RepID=A0A7J7DW61_TRIWF|nr:uncharacterized protein LOC119995225 isoform X1 [Tripterygium wilfordii]XP_038697591.1 uncharacterized protein LOC119995225 isoform X1 [Tripterygium wilfordii]KAF5750541.1 hypothetical protein HS088_TW03G00879 [Tripterygium wilfordii]
MAVQLQNRNFIPSSSSNPYVSWSSFSGTHKSPKRVAYLDHLLSNWGGSGKRCLVRLTLSVNYDHGLRCRWVGYSKSHSKFRKSRRMGQLCPHASADDGLTVNGSPQKSTSNGIEEMRTKLNQSLQGGDYNDGLVQSLHDAARVFELAIKEQGSLSKLSWFSTAWLGVDRTAWVKTLSYQASVYSILQAASEISSRGECRDKDVNIFVRRSLLRLSAPLESYIREELSAKQPEAYEWFWSEQVPAVVTSFVNHFEGDSRITSATALRGRGTSLGSGNTIGVSLLMLALTCIAVITKLGPAKISCAQFFSTIPDITGRLMDLLVDLIPISKAYHSINDIGLRRKFLDHFGSRAAACRVQSDCNSEEVNFWVDLVQNQLQRVIDRERIWSRLTTSESIEVLERDLAIFGFFIALGRSTKSFLVANGYDDLNDPIEGFVRFLIGGSILYYPQLSSISSYQLYVEVVCEELNWLPFYPGGASTSKQSHGHRSKLDGPPNPEAIPQVLDVCSHWIQSVIKYSKWLESPSNVKAAKFLSRGHKKLMECKEEFGISRNEMIESNENDTVERSGSVTYPPSEKEPESFDRALESVEEALIRLENLLQELHVSSSNSGKKQLKAACCDLEKIRKLKKQAEFLEASFRAKADFLQQGDDESDFQSCFKKQRVYLKGDKRNLKVTLDRSSSKSRGLWSFFFRPPTRKPDSGISVAGGPGNEFIEQTISIQDTVVSDSDEIRRFEVLRNELMELEKRVQRSTGQSENEEDTYGKDDGINYLDDANTHLAQFQKKENIIEKSFEKLKEASTDVLQGTQLLAIDVAAATGLLRRVLIGDELTEKEKKALRRTLTDLASIVPIGFLMLLPVTAVGHAAMLAAIQRYVPALIPSTYGSERLDLLRQLEKLKEMEASEVDSVENEDKLS